MKSPEEDSAPLYLEHADELWREGLRQGRRLSFRVASASMSPILRVGDRIMVERYPAGKKPRLGDIVMMSLGDKWMVHRIVGKKRRGGRMLYRQKGDAGYGAGIVADPEIAGKVVGIAKKNGALLDLEKGPRKVANFLLGCFFCFLEWMRQGGDFLQAGSGTGREDVTGASWFRLTVARLFRWMESAASRLAAAIIRGGRG